MLPVGSLILKDKLKRLPEGACPEVLRHAQKRAGGTGVSLTGDPVRWSYGELRTSQRYLRFSNTSLRITCVVFRSSLDLAGVSGSELILFFLCSQHVSDSKMLAMAELCASYQEELHAHRNCNQLQAPKLEGWSHLSPLVLKP